jgi:transcriptional regulator with XRE-family HTH domain
MKETLQQRLAGIIRQERISQGLTLQQMADALGINIRNYQRIEAGERNLTAATIERIADALGCRVALQLQQGC